MLKMITDYKKWILNRLLDKYEASKAYNTGSFSRRIILPVSTDCDLQNHLEISEEKRSFLSAVAELKDMGLTDFSWVKHETGNLVDKIWLVPESITKAYSETGRVSPSGPAQDLCGLIKKALLKLPPNSDFYLYLKEQLNLTEQKKKIQSPFVPDMMQNENLLECLVQLSHVPDQMERVFSTRIFGDSKLFERNLRTTVVGILRKIQEQNNGSDEDSVGDPLSDDDLLALHGLYRWPEIFEFTGPLIIHLYNGTIIDTSSQIYGAYINSDTVRHISHIDGHSINKVVFIENKANYTDYISKHRQDTELVVYHGGFYSPVKSNLLSKICGGCLQASFYHWSDIDLGGFRIFHRLKKNIQPTVMPLFMDIPTLQNHLDQCLPIKKENYIKQLSSLLTNPEYDVFHEVIAYMIESKVRLEQENLIE